MLRSNSATVARANLPSQSGRGPGSPSASHLELIDEFLSQISRRDKDKLSEGIRAVIQKVNMKHEQDMAMLRGYDTRIDGLRVEHLEQIIEVKEKIVKLDEDKKKEKELYDIEVRNLKWKHEEALQTRVEVEKGFKAKVVEEKNECQKILRLKDDEMRSLRTEMERIKADRDELLQENIFLHEKDKRKQFHINSLDHKHRENERVRLNALNERTALLTKMRNLETEARELDTQVQDLKDKLDPLDYLLKFRTQHEFSGNGNSPPLKWEEMEYAMKAAMMGLRMDNWNRPPTENRGNNCRNMLFLGSEELRNGARNAPSHVRQTGDVGFYRAIASFVFSILKTVQQDDDIRNKLLQHAREIDWILRQGHK